MKIYQIVGPKVGGVGSSGSNKQYHSLKKTEGSVPSTGLFIYYYENKE